MKDRKVPYIVIVIMCVVIAVFRSTLIPGWPWYIHVMLYFCQVAAMIGVWELILQINKKLENRYSFETQPTKRILMQVMMTELMLAPVFILTYFLVKPYLPFYIDNRFLAILFMLIFVVLLLLNIGFYAHRFFHDWRQSVDEKAKLELQAVQLEKEKSLMQYHHLK